MMAALTLPELPAVCAALAALVSPACEPGPALEARAAIVVDSPAVDLGPVFEGALLEHEWELSVRAPSSIASAKTDCGCTLARLERRGESGWAAYELGAPLEAGERLRVRLRYDTRGRRGPAARAVTLATSEGPFALSLSADVRPWLLSEPHEIAFTRVREGQGAEAAFEVRSAAGEAIALQATRVALPPWVALELEPEAPDAAGRAALWRVRALLGTEAPRGTYSYPLEVESDVPIPGSEVLGEARRYSIAPSWTVQIVGPVALSSPRLEFGLVRGDETVAQSLRLESFDPSFTPDSPTARLEPLEAGQAFPLARTARVHVRPAGQACEIELVLAGLDREVTGTFLARLVVETGHPALPRLEALVRGVRVPDEGAR